MGGGGWAPEKNGFQSLGSVVPQLQDVAIEREHGRFIVHSEQTIHVGLNIHMPFLAGSCVDPVGPNQMIHALTAKYKWDRNAVRAAPPVGWEGPARRADGDGRFREPGGPGGWPLPGP